MLVAVALSNAARFVVFVSCTRDASRRYRLTCVMEVVPCRVLSLTDDTVRWALIIETKKLPTNVSSSDVTSIATRSSTSVMPRCSEWRRRMIARIS